MAIIITENTNFNNPSLEREHGIVKEGGKGTQKIWRFKNGFGCSVVRFSIPNIFKLHNKKIGSYGIENGLWELAVIKFGDNNEKNDDWKITYETELTKDVIGYLTEEQVEKYLKKVKGLK